MSFDVVMPQMGESIAEGTIVRWIKKVGDSIDKDEPLFEISTDKVDAEIPAPEAGTIVEIIVQQGQTAGYQHQIQAARRQLPRKLLADARRRPSDNCPGAKRVRIYVGHERFSFVFSLT